MTLESIYYVSQTIAVVAILGSLAGIYFQQRLDNKIARIDMSQRVSASYGDSMRQLMSNEALAAAFRKVMFDRTELTGLESTQLQTYFNLSMTAHSDAFLAYSDNLLDPSFLDVMDHNFAWYLTAPVFAREWPRVSRLGMYPPNFISHVNARATALFPQLTEQELIGGASL